MSFNYILDMFGKFRKRKTRFSEIEEDALSLLASFIDGTIGSKEFAIAFDGIRKNFIKLTEKDGQIVIDENTPLWLNSFLGMHFMKWRQYQQVKWHFEEHPEELLGETKVRFEHLWRMGYDEQFIKTCKNMLEELKK